MEELSLFLKKAEKKQAKKKSKKNDAVSDEGEFFRKNKFDGLELITEEEPLPVKSAALVKEEADIPATSPIEKPGTGEDDEKEKEELFTPEGDVVSANVVTIQAARNLRQRVKTWEEIKKEQQRQEAERPPPDPEKEKKTPGEEVKQKKFIARGNRNATGAITAEGGLPKPFSMENSPTLEEMISRRKKKINPPLAALPSSPGKEQRPEVEEEVGGNLPENKEKAPEREKNLPEGKEENLPEKKEENLSERKEEIPESSPPMAVASPPSAPLAKTNVEEKAPVEKSEKAPSGPKKYVPPSVRSAGAYVPPTFKPKEAEKKPHPTPFSSAKPPPTTTTSFSSFSPEPVKPLAGKPTTHPSTANNTTTSSTSASHKNDTTSKYVPPSRPDGGRVYRPPVSSSAGAYKPPTTTTSSYSSFPFSVPGSTERTSHKGFSHANESRENPPPEGSSNTAVNHSNTNPTTVTMNKYVSPSQRASGGVYRPPTSTKTESYKPPSKRDQ